MANSSFSIDYERITRPKRGRPYPFKCRRCGALATWKETFASRDRRHFRTPWCLCDRCYQAATGEHTGNQYTMERGNNFPLPKTAEHIGERSTSLTGRETKKEQGGDRRSEDFSRANNLPLKTAERIAEQFDGPDRPETKKDHGGDRRSAGASSSQNGDLKTVDLIADQFNVSDRTRSGENHLHGTPIRDDLPPAP